ncbi:MAG: hypothetical protein D6714_18655 [Bacteroidetes bacterium]|nr:MAG: hypothetical protein D6714_18655 [Bacteroidota bacterium]
MALPPDKPAPRACLGYSFVQQLFILKKLGLIGGQLLEDVRASIDLLTDLQPQIKEQAMHIARKIQDKRPVIYAADRMEAVAIRFRQQLAENAKMLSWHHVFPELNHNELVGWRTPDDSLAPIYIRNRDDHRRTQIRMDITQEIIRKYTPHVIEIWSKGGSFAEQIMYCVHLTDWVSVFLADLRKVDVMEIDAINHLKSALAKV